MSDTPRTDSEAGYFDDSGCWKYRENGETVDSDFARRLERELNTANAIVEKAKAYQSMKDSEMRLRCGELTAQEIRTVRAVLNNIISP